MHREEQGDSGKPFGAAALGALSSPQEPSSDPEQPLSTHSISQEASRASALVTADRTSWETWKNTAQGWEFTLVGHPGLFQLCTAQCHSRRLETAVLCQSLCSCPGGTARCGWMWMEAQPRLLDRHGLLSSSPGRKAVFLQA